MPSNIHQFDHDLRYFAEILVPQDLHKIVQKLSMEILRRIVLRTPVDTGRARSNWIVAVNKVPQGVIKIDKLSREQATSFALNNGIPIIERSKPFTAISIANNLPYIGILEFGRGDGRPGSHQAPQGMVRVTLAEIQSQFT